MMTTMAKILLYGEWTAGIIALVLTAMAFTEMSWGEGGSSQDMSRKAMARAKRLFIWAGGFWAVTILCFIFMR